MIFDIVLTLLGLASLGRANYFMDDTNTTIEYTISAPDLQWEAFGSQAIVATSPNGDDSSTVFLSAGDDVLGIAANSFEVSSASWFDGTFIYGPCQTTDGCSISIPFVGSGATLYVLQAGPQGLNASIAVDGGPATFYALSPPPPPNYYQSNVSIFDVQSLPFGPHVLALNVYDYGLNASNMMFDYAAINDTPATTPTSSIILATSSSAVPLSSMASPELSVLSAPATSTPSATASASNKSAGGLSSSHSHVGTTIAGILACVLTMALFLAICIWRRRRSRSGHASAFHDSADAESGNNFPKSPFGYTGGIPSPAPFISSTYRHVRSDSHPAAQQVILAKTISPFPHGRMPAHPMARPTRHATSDSIGLASGGPLQVSKSRLDTAVDGSLESDAASPSSAKSPSSSAGSSSTAVHNMTDEQIDFVANLLKNNVPAETVARVMEEMLTGGFPVFSGGEDELVDGLLNLTGGAPPSYESHA